MLFIYQLNIEHTLSDAHQEQLSALSIRRLQSVHVQLLEKNNEEDDDIE